MAAFYSTTACHTLNTALQRWRNQLFENEGEVHLKSAHTYCKESRSFLSLVFGLLFAILLFKVTVDRTKRISRVKKQSE